MSDTEIQAPAAVPAKKKLSLAALQEAYEKGVWRDLPCGGTVKLRLAGFERGAKVAAALATYRDEHGLAATDPIPNKVFIEINRELFLDVTTDLDDETFETSLRASDGSIDPIALREYLSFPVVHQSYMTVLAQLEGRSFEAQEVNAGN